MSPKPKRPRTLRREADRTFRKEVAAREKLAVTGPGGARDRAFSVPAASVVEIRARATRCIQCGGELELRDHDAAPGGGGMLRVVRMVCRGCHTPREIWFRIEPALPS